MDLRPGAPGGGADIRDRPATAMWTVPAELLEERGLAAEDVVIVRAPTPLKASRIRTGDRLLVDVGESGRRSTAGLVIAWKSEAFRLVKRSLRSRQMTIAGTILGRWDWIGGEALPRPMRSRTMSDACGNWRIPRLPRVKCRDLE